MNPVQPLQGGLSNPAIVGMPSKKGVQGESNSRPLRPERRIMPLDHAPNQLIKILDPGIEPGTYCVLGSRHNQLDQPSTSSEGLEPSISRFVVSRLIQFGHANSL